MKNELKTQAAKLSQEEQYQIRKSIIRLSQKGKGNEEIAAIELKTRGAEKRKTNTNPGTDHHS